MTLKKVSSEYIIAKTVRDFKIEDTSWIGDSIDWIGDAIEAIGYHCGFVDKTAQIDVKNHLANIPCDLISLYGVAYDGARLPLGSDLSGLALYKNEDESVSNITDVEFQELRKLWAKLDALNESVSEWTANELEEKQVLLDQISEITYNKRLNNSIIEQSIIPYYNLNSQYIQTSFSQGTITILYRAFQLDEKGFPMIIDTYKYREAVKWKIMASTLMQGYKHPTIDLKTAMSFWEEFRFKASNEQKMPSLDSLERFHNRWHSIKRGMDLGSDWFLNAEAQQGSIY